MSTQASLPTPAVAPLHVAGAPTTEFLLQEATEHPDYRARKEAAYKLYHAGIAEGVKMANAAHSFITNKAVAKLVRK
jgi:hypothetical protein